MKRPAYEIVLAAPAEQDFLKIMQWSAEQFGVAAADRYEALIGQALSDIYEDPFRPGAKKRPELSESTFTYHLASSRNHVSGDPVKAPRHFLLYRIIGLRIEVLRMLHDHRDLTKYLSDA